MKSTPIRSRITNKGLTFDSNTRVEILGRAALAGVRKEVAVGFRLVNGDLISEEVWFEPRILAIDICRNFKKTHKTLVFCGDKTCKDKADNFVESLISPEVSNGHEQSADTLEQIATLHLSEEIFRVVFEPYSLDDDTKVDVFVHYRKYLLSVSVQMEILVPFVNHKCFCQSHIHAREFALSLQ
ncbi:MAG: hypothetical protein WCJ74_02385 [bacterium]